MRKNYLIRTITPLALAAFVAGLLVIGLAFRASAGRSVLVKSDEKDNGRRCTLHSAKDAYGFALVGSLAAVGPIATSGTTNFDGEGNDSGKFTVTTFGATQQFTFSGSYTVNPNCTGTATLNISPSVFGFSVLHFDAVGTNEEKEIKWLITDPGIVIAGTLTKQ
jgi:hypothetical protein